MGATLHESGVEVAKMISMEPGNPFASQAMVDLIGALLGEASLGSVRGVHFLAARLVEATDERRQENED